jgi:hypothetical protein
VSNIILKGRSKVISVNISINDRIIQIGSNCGGGRAFQFAIFSHIFLRKVTRQLRSLTSQTIAEFKSYEFSKNRGSVGDHAVDFDLGLIREIEDSCFLDKPNFPIVCIDSGRLLTSVLTGSKGTINFL